MFGNKIDAVLIVYLTILNKALFIFDTHTVLRNKTAWVTVIVAQVNQNIVNTRLINFPATVWIHLAAAFRNYQRTTPA